MSRRPNRQRIASRLKDENKASREGVHITKDSHLPLGQENKQRRDDGRDEDGDMRRVEGAVAQLHDLRQETLAREGEKYVIGADDRGI
jgi:hypothetical protein